MSTYPTVMSSNPPPSSSITTQPPPLVLYSDTHSDMRTYADMDTDMDRNTTTDGSHNTTYYNTTTNPAPVPQKRGRLIRHIHRSSNESYTPISVQTNTPLDTIPIPQQQFKTMCNDVAGANGDGA